MANSVPVHKPVAADEMEALVNQCDLVVTIGFGLLLPEYILKIPKFGFINLHFSLLPRWRGAAPVQRALEAGDTRTGVTVFKLDKGMDTGPIYSSLAFDIESTMNTADLLAELSKIGVSVVFDAISAIEQGIEPTDQSDSGATRADKLTSDQGEIDWTKEALSIVNKIRAFSPNPGAWSSLRGIKIKIDSAIVSSEEIEAGEIALQDKKVLVGTSGGSIELLTVKPAGKNSMSAQAWANGLHLVPGERFEREDG